jgi:hypothetical protein
MSLVEQCGLVLENPHLEENEKDDDVGDEESRFMVASDIRPAIERL